MKKTSDFFKVSEIDVVYRSKIKATDRPQIKSSKDAYDVISSNINIEDQNHIESFYIMLLNQKNRVLGIKKISSGGLSMCIVDVRVVFQTMIKTNAVGAIVWHNHPSGELEPSIQDKNITKKLQQGSNLLDLKILDHLIINAEGQYLSMADKSLM